jgi:hypothetical protein
MSPEAAALLKAREEIERGANVIPDTVVVSPAVWDALRAQSCLRYDARSDSDWIAGLRVRMSPVAKGMAFFSNGKLVKVVL